MSRNIIVNFPNTKYEEMTLEFFKKGKSPTKSHYQISFKKSSTHLNTKKKKGTERQYRRYWFNSQAGNYAALTESKLTKLHKKSEHFEGCVGICRGN